MEKLNLELVWTESMYPLITELNGVPVPRQVKEALKEIPGYYNSITLRGYMRGSAFVIESIEIEGVPCSNAELNPLLYEAGYPEYLISEIDG